MKIQKTIEVMYEKGVFKPLEPLELEIPEGTKVKKYKKILKVNISSEELNELYHEYVSERADIP
jgi:predicted DNA-binding antitoxin AbrB/MazE fold protein